VNLTQLKKLYKRLNVKRARGNWINIVECTRYAQELLAGIPEEYIIEGVNRRVENFLRTIEKIPLDVLEHFHEDILLGKIVVPAWMEYVKIDQPMVIKGKYGNLHVNVMNAEFSIHSNNQGSDKQIDISKKTAQEWVDHAVIMIHQKKDKHYKYLYIGPEGAIVIGKVSPNAAEATTIITWWHMGGKFQEMDKHDADKYKELCIFIDHLMSYIK